MAETPILRDILVAVTSLPDGMFWRANVGKAVAASGNVVVFNVKGMADIMGCYKRRGVAIEVKDLRGTQQTRQKNFQRAWERAGGLYIIARSVEQAMEGLSHA